MTINEKIAKAQRIADHLVKNKGIERDFAEATGLYMVASGIYQLKKARMAVFLAGPNGGEKFKKQITG